MAARTNGDPTECNGCEEMRYYQFMTNAEAHVGVQTDDNTVLDLTSIEPCVTSTLGLFHTAAITGSNIDSIAESLIGRGGGNLVPLDELLDPSNPGCPYKLFPPIWAPEVWAAGVTYHDSMRERQAESGTPDVYQMVYEADRPEVFFKATAARIVAPFDDIGVRADSDWNVPEPELAFVLYGGRMAAFTVGNDVSSRTIEGANPLYLPQAKLYDRSCSIGPCLVTPDSLGDPQDLPIRMSIERDGAEAFSGETSTSEMKRTCGEIADWLQRHNPVPDGTTVLTGTPLIPPPEFSLSEGDVVSIDIDGIGRLTNTAVSV